MTAMEAARRAVCVAPAIEIEAWGSHAERFALRHISARVAAVYSRSLHLEADGDFLCIGEASIGKGPLNALLLSRDWTRLQGSMPTAGADVRIAHSMVRIGGAVIRTAAAQRWCPLPWPRPATTEGLAAALEELERIARDRAPADGLARPALGLPLDRPTVLDRIAQPRVERLCRWLAARMLGPTPRPPPVELLGLGPGLTPSGDDLLCGALVALHAIGQIDTAHELEVAIAGAAPAATCPLSVAFLKAAVEGLGAEPLHATIAAALEGRHATLARPIEALGRTGHTSGWDALAGAVLVLRAFRTTGRHGAGVARPRNP